MQSLVQDFEVVVLDNLSSGKIENIADVEKKVKLIVGDIRDAAVVKRAIKDCKCEKSDKRLQIRFPSGRPSKR